LRRRQLDPPVVSLHPFEDVLRAELCGIVRGLVEHRIGNHDVGLDVEEIIEGVGYCESDQRAGVDDEKLDPTAHAPGTATCGRAPVAPHALAAAPAARTDVARSTGAGRRHTSRRRAGAGARGLPSRLASKPAAP